MEREKRLERSCSNPTPNGGSPARPRQSTTCPSTSVGDLCKHATKGPAIVMLQDAASFPDDLGSSSSGSKIMPETSISPARRHQRNRGGASKLRMQKILRKSTTSISSTTPERVARLRSQSAMSPGQLLVPAMGVSAMQELPDEAPSFPRTGSAVLPIVRVQLGRSSPGRRQQDGRNKVRYWGTASLPSASLGGRKWGSGKVHASP